MGLFTGKELNTFEDLFFDQLEDLYDAENRIADALPKMSEACSSPELKMAFQDHLHETEMQVQRLKQIFQQLGKQPRRATCEAMQGLISEGDEVISATGDPAVKDAALIASAQRVEHYEIAGYGSARTFAEHLHYVDAARLLQQSLDEEKSTDQKLTGIAERSVNLQAAHS